jgi:hypothetical protein
MLLERLERGIHAVWRAEQEETKAGDEGHWPGMLSSLAALFAAVQHLN